MPKEKMTNRTKILNSVDSKTKLLALICIVIEGAILGSINFLPDEHRIIAFVIAVIALVFMIVGVIYIDFQKLKRPDLLKEHIIAEKKDTFSQLGLINGFAARSVHIKHEYENRFNAANIKIDFFGFGLRSLREDFLNDFERWLTKVPVRVLLIDPLAPSETHTYTKQRDIEEGNHIGSIDSDVFQFIKATVCIKNKFKERFNVRLYRCIPAVNYCQIDGVIFWGPYLIGKQSRNTPTFLINNEGSLFSVFQEHYEQIWNDDNFSRAAFRLNSDGSYYNSFDKEID